LYKEATFFYKTPGLGSLENRIRELIEIGKNKEAIILGIEFDEYLTALDAESKFFYFEPLIEEIHKERLI
jgi:hypothetical protein